MALNCQEQPLLNYLIVTSGRKYTTLRDLSRMIQSRDILFEFWAGSKGVVIRDGELMLSDGTRPQLFLVHWAGQHQPRFRDKVIFFILRILRIQRRNYQLTVRFFMPYKELWDYYRRLTGEESH